MKTNKIIFGLLLIALFFSNCKSSKEPYPDLDCTIQGMVINHFTHERIGELEVYVELYEWGSDPDAWVPHAVKAGSDITDAYGLFEIQYLIKIEGVCGHLRIENASRFEHFAIVNGTYVENIMDLGNLDMFGGYDGLEDDGTYTIELYPI